MQTVDHRWYTVCLLPIYDHVCRWLFQLLRLPHTSRSRHCASDTFGVASRTRPQRPVRFYPVRRTVLEKHHHIPSNYFRQLLSLLAYKLRHWFLRTEWNGNGIRILYIRSAETRQSAEGCIMEEIERDRPSQTFQGAHVTGALAIPMR